MLTNIITENTILFKFQIVAIYTIFISQKAVKAWIIVDALNFSLLISKNDLMDFLFQKCFRDLCFSWKRLILMFCDQKFEMTDFLKIGQWETTISGSEWSRSWAKHLEISTNNDSDMWFVRLCLSSYAVAGVRERVCIARQDCAWPLEERARGSASSDKYVICSWALLR